MKLIAFFIDIITHTQKLKGRRGKMGETNPISNGGCKMNGDDDSKNGDYDEMNGAGSEMSSEAGKDLLSAREMEF